MPEIPFAHQWSIDENELLPLKDSGDEYLCSTSVSNIPEFEYYLAISPNGHNNENRGKTWMLLRLEFKNVKKVEVGYTFTIEAANYSESFYCAYEKSGGLGISICETGEFFDPEKKYKKKFFLI